jgi:starch synthase
MLTKLAREHPDQVAVRLEFNDTLARRIYAASDMFLMPSRYEPCGLGQMISLRYGSIPVVRATGGLADTIAEFDPATKKGNGFSFEQYSGVALLAAMMRALLIYRTPRLWDRLVRNAMKCDFSWRVSAKKYEKAYRRAIKQRKAARRPSG